VLRDEGYDRVPFSRILDAIQRHDGITRARARAAAFTDEARAIIQTFPDSPSQRALAALTELVLDRDH